MSSTPELTRRVDSALDSLRRKGIVQVERTELVNGIQVRFSAEGAWCRFNFYHSSRRGFSAVPAGGDPALGARITSILEGSEYPVQGDVSRIGSDEAGKGDYLGPLTVGAMFGDTGIIADLVGMGVTDSKRLGDQAIRTIAGRIRSDFPGCFSIVSVPPEEYNREFTRLKGEGRNSLDLLALIHARAIGELIGRGHAPALVVIDRFCPPGRIRHLLPQGDYGLDLRVRGESDPVVAAASILARDAYLDGLDLISARWGIRAMAGAGAPTDAVARRFVEEHGGGILTRIAKLHFRNTEKVLKLPT